MQNGERRMKATRQRGHQATRQTVAGDDAGQTAHYMLRWVATTAEKAPWSETASATIAA